MSSVSTLLTLAEGSKTRSQSLWLCESWVLGMSSVPTSLTLAEGSKTRSQSLALWVLSPGNVQCLHLADAGWGVQDQEPVTVALWVLSPGRGCLHQQSHPNPIMHFIFLSLAPGVHFHKSCLEKWKLLSHVWLFATPCMVACQAPLFMEFSRP